MESQKIQVVQDMVVISKLMVPMLMLEDGVIIRQ